MIGYIYKCTNKINGKCYIGQTRRKRYEDRWLDHKYKAFSKSIGRDYNVKFHRALRKYGWNSFEWEVLEYKNFSILKELCVWLNNREIYYIEKYNSYNNGYNSTKGGNQPTILPKKVVAYNINKEIIGKFDSTFDAAKNYNFSDSQVKRNCEKHSYCVIYNGTQIIFRYENEECSNDDIKNALRTGKQGIVVMYDSNGEYIRKFMNPKEASQELNIRCGWISELCTRRKPFIVIDGIKYTFRYNGDAVSIEEIKWMTETNIYKQKVRAINSITNEVLKEFESIREAARYYSINSGGISKVLSGKYNYAGKYNNIPIKWEKF